MRVLTVSYNRLLNQSEVECNMIAEFLDHQVDVPKMLKTIDPTLHSNRRDA